MLTFVQLNNLLTTKLKEMYLVLRKRKRSLRNTESPILILAHPKLRLHYFPTVLLIWLNIWSQIIKIIALNELLKCWLVNVVVCSTTSSKSTSTATVPSSHKKSWVSESNFSLHSNKKSDSYFPNPLFLLPHIDGKPYSRLSRSFVGISAQ